MAHKNNQSTHQVFETLKDAVDHNEFEKFNMAYIDFLKQFPEFERAHSETPTNVKVTNAIFGRKGYFLRETNDVQAEDILRKGKEASKVMARLSVEDRLEFLNILKAKVDEHKEEIALTIIADTGKPAKASRDEISSKGDQWFGFAQKEAANQLGDRKLAGGLVVKSKPLGVAQIIGAYNYPYALAIGGIVGALAGGNSAVVSAPMKAPNWVFPFKKAADEAIEAFATGDVGKKLSSADIEALKAGLIQTSSGINEKLTTGADVVHFVGSDKVGKYIAGKRGTKKTILEMGGGNVVTVMKSALENQTPKSIADAIYAGFGPATGQRCTAPRVLCVEHGAEAVTEELKKICDEGPGATIGNPFKEGVLMGPLVDATAHQKMEDAIRLARDLGAKVHGDMNFKDSEHNLALTQAYNKDAYWVKPVVIDWSGVDDAKIKEVVNPLIQDEIFGPLLHIVRPVKNLEQAIKTTNTLDNHKLAGAIFTSRHQDAIDYSDGTNTTSLAVNAAPKDQSPLGPHGHPGLETIGGDTHFKLYVDSKAIAVNEKVALGR